VNQTPFKILRFSTEDFPQHERVKAYREIYSRIISQYDIEPIGDRPFHFDATLCSVPGLGLASAFASPCLRTHGLQHVHNDDFVLGMSLGVGCTLHQLGREATIDEGEAVLMSDAEPAVVGISSAGRHVSLRIPHSVLGSRVANLEDCLPRKIPRSAESRLLTSYVGAIWSNQALTKPELRDVVVGHVYDLVCLMLGAKGETRELAEQRGARAARREAILREIMHRSGEPDLSAAKIAILLGVTPRYVHLLLEETGKSFTHHVLEKRLEKAAALARDPQWRGRKIADIAAEAAFTDLSYFNRAFRRHYGATPSDIREAAKRERN
jgi:AraC-like DNA-binding protein